MGNENSFLANIRKPDKSVPLNIRIMVSVLCAMSGFAVGILQKWLDSTAVNELPEIVQRLDIGNYFGRFAIWILIGTIISVYASTPVRAAVNTFLFLISMVAGYYLYCNFVLGFLPSTYMMIWIVLSFVSPFFAFICWYAKGNGMPAVLISACILGVLFSQAFLITQGFYMTYIPEVITWLLGVVILYRKPKEFALEMLISIVVAFVYQMFVPYWG